MLPPTTHGSTNVVLKAERIPNDPLQDIFQRDGTNTVESKKFLPIKTSTAIKKMAKILLEQNKIALNKSSLTHNEIEKIINTTDTPGPIDERIAYPLGVI